MVAEAGDQFAIEQLALVPEVAVVVVVLVRGLGLRKLKVEKHAELVRVREKLFPLGELARVVVGLVVFVDRRERVAAVAPNVHREHRRT